MKRKRYRYISQLHYANDSIGSLYLQRYPDPLFAFYEHFIRLEISDDLELEVYPDGHTYGINNHWEKKVKDLNAVDH